MIFRFLPVACAWTLQFSMSRKQQQQQENIARLLAVRDSLAKQKASNLTGEVTKAARHHHGDTAVASRTAGSKSATTAAAAPSNTPAVTAAESAASEPAPKTPPTRREKRQMELEEAKAAKAALRAAKAEEAKAAKAAKAEEARVAKAAQEEEAKAAKAEETKAAKAAKAEETKAAKAAKAAEARAKKRASGDSGNAVERPTAKAKLAKKPAAAEPGQPDFEISWANHPLVMDFFGMTKDEATCTLMSVLGSYEGGGEEYWASYRKNQFGVDLEQDGEPEELPEAPAAADPALSTSKPMSHAEAAFWDDSQPLPEEPMVGVEDEEEEEENGEDDIDGEEISSTTSYNPPPDPPAAGATSVAKTVPDEEEPMIDTLETLPAEEPVLQPLPKDDDPAWIAREQLAKRLKSQPTPARSKVWDVPCCQL